MSFRFQGLHADQFADLFTLSDAELATRGYTRVTADAPKGFPCRISLADAPEGEELLLINYEHQPAHSPYRAKGPIFIGRHSALFDGGDVPPALRARLLSVRAYDKDGMIVDAGVADGKELEPMLETFFAREDTAYIHVHYAARGCYAARVERG